MLRPSASTVSQDNSVAPRRINEIIHGKRSISADTALGLGKYFNMTPRFRMNLQSRYDLAWKIHVVRCLQIQGRDGFAILKYAKPLMTQEMRTDRYASGEQFGESL